MRIAHIITRLILGGAQENTLLTCEDLLRDYGDDVLLITGPPLGPEGSLLERARQRGCRSRSSARCGARSIPGTTCKVISARNAYLRNFRPDVVHTHSAKAGMLGRMAAHASCACRRSSTRCTAHRFIRTRAGGASSVRCANGRRRALPCGW